MTEHTQLLGEIVRDSIYPLIKDRDDWQTYEIPSGGIKSITVIRRDAFVTHSGATVPEQLVMEVHYRPGSWDRFVFSPDGTLDPSGYKPGLAKGKLPKRTSMKEFRRGFEIAKVSII